MGNVNAHTNPPSPSLSIPLTPPSNPEPKEDAASASPPAPVKTNNPGTMEELHKQCIDVFPTVFEGGKFIMNKALSQHFQVAHTINLNTVQPPGYRFSATYLGNFISPTEVYPVLVGDIDPSGNMNANIIHQFTPNIRTKFMAQIENSKWQASQLSTDWKGENNTCSLTLCNVDPAAGTALGVFHYLQKVSKRISLGSELALQKGPQVPGGCIAIHSLAGRYEGDNFTFSGTLGGSGIHLSYHQQCSENLQVAAEIETSSRMQEAVATTGFHMEIPKANCTFKGKIDSNGTVGAVMEKKLTPLPFTLALSALHSHGQDKFRVGVGFFIG